VSIRDSHSGWARIGPPMSSMDFAAFPSVVLGYGACDGKPSRAVHADRELQA
jgi:hypothetical protein